MKALGQGIWAAETKKKRRQTLWCAMGSKPTIVPMPISKILHKDQSVKWKVSFAGKIIF